MDYCSSCRRHLNGALVCPGCGAYAPDIAPPTSSAPPVKDGRTGSTLAVTSAPPVPDARAADVEGSPPARPGRAARRRQLARWKKNKRRAAVASAFALVGGGLTVAAMDRHATDRAQAATASDQRSMGVVDERTPVQDPPGSTPATSQRTPRSSHAPSQSQTQPQAKPPTADAPRQQAPAAPPRTPPPVALPDAAAPPRPAAPAPPQPQSTAPSAGETAPEPSDTTTERTSPPPTADSTQSGATRTGPALISTSPTEVCVLVVCLG